MNQRNEPGLIGRMAGAVTGKVIDVMPIEAVIDQLDLDDILDQVDVNHLLDRVDVNRVLDRVDVHRLLDRVDINRFLSDTDLEALVRRAGIPAIVAETTGSLAGGGLDTVRRQLVGLDTLVTRLVDGIFHRGDTTMDGPELLVTAVEQP